MVEALPVEDYYRSFSAGVVLYRAGDLANELILIRTGTVRLIARSQGVERSAGCFGGEELVGEEALIPNARRTRTAQAIETVTALVIERDTFRALVRERPDLGERVMLQLAKRLLRNEEQIENTLTTDPSARVINSLLRALDGRSETTLSLSPLELSNRTALGLDTAKAVVRELQDRGYLEAGDQTITIVDPNALRELQHLLSLKEEVRHGLG